MPRRETRKNDGPRVGYRTPAYTSGPARTRNDAADGRCIDLACWNREAHRPYAVLRRVMRGKAILSVYRYSAIPPLRCLRDGCPEVRTCQITWRHGRLSRDEMPSAIDETRHP